MRCDHPDDVVQTHTNVQNRSQRDSAVRVSVMHDYLDESVQRYGRVFIVGGSPLYTDDVPWIGVSINGFRPECVAAAINRSRRDRKRVSGFEIVLMPHEWGIQLPNDMPKGVQATTCLLLAMECEARSIPTTIVGVCGYASEFHDGDFEMHYMKRKMQYVTVVDPRPRW